MPFNKGDFTQQGVAGHVNANLRLNEKRLVNIDLTSNEEAEGCTITGAVTDLLNNEVYPIGAGVSGNIEITENGENINVAPYATATVNVSGGGGLTRYTDITFNNIDLDTFTLNLGLSDVEGGDIVLDSDNNILFMDTVSIAAGNSATVRFANAEVPGYNITTVGYHSGILLGSRSNNFTDYITDLVNMTLDVQGEPGNYVAMGIITDKEQPASCTIRIVR